jgi:glycosyltransferase involved in cell wall biosynthesis
MESLSVVIITFNEAENIERCIRSVAGLADEVLVVDSFSSDATPALAAQLGAVVVQRSWPGYSLQREWAAKNARFEFVLALDADECLSPELYEAIANEKSQPNADAYIFARRNRIGTYWVRHGAWYPDKKLRLFFRSKVRFEGAGGHDAVTTVDGSRISALRGDLLHYANKGIQDRLTQVNKLSGDSATYLFQAGKKTSWLKILLKPGFRFAIEYFIRLGVLDGFYGFAIAASSAQYVFWREYKLMEMYRNFKAEKLQKPN